MYKKLTVQATSIEHTSSFVIKNTKIPAYKRKKGNAMRIVSSVDLPNMQAQMDEQLYYVVECINLEDGISTTVVYENFEYVADSVAFYEVRPIILKVLKYVGNPGLHTSGLCGVCVGEVNISDVLGYKFVFKQEVLKELENKGAFGALAKLAQYLESTGDFYSKDKIGCIMERHNKCLLCGGEQLFDAAYYKSTGLWKCSAEACY